MYIRNGFIQEFSTLRNPEKDTIIEKETNHSNEQD